MEDKALDDTRVLLVAKRLGCSHGDAFHALARVWCWLYGKGGAPATDAEVDAVGRREGLASAMLESGLAEATPEGLRIRGDKRAKNYQEHREEQRRKSHLAVNKLRRNREADLVVVNTNDHPPGNPPGNPPGPTCTCLSLSLLPRPSSSGKSDRPIKRRVVNPEALAIAEYLRDAIRSHSPSMLDASAGWAWDVDLALRIDGRTPEELRSVIDYAHRTPEGAFWTSNLLSGKKLRLQATRLLIERQRRPRGSVAGLPGEGRVWTPGELAKAAQEQMAREREETDE